jgi:hypothetical protein
MYEAAESINRRYGLSALEGDLALGNRDDANSVMVAWLGIVSLKTPITYHHEIVKKTPCRTYRKPHFSSIQRVPVIEVRFGRTSDLSFGVQQPTPFGL